MNERKPFTTDGCSMFPDGDWGGCCAEHDRVYWVGGTPRDRLDADRQLRKCVADHGGFWYMVLAWVMFRGVRIGGASFWPVPWRWGYGYRWPQAKWKNGN